jgi:hypothetical protein
MHFGQIRNNQVSLCGDAGRRISDFTSEDQKGLAVDNELA